MRILNDPLKYLLVFLFVLTATLYSEAQTEVIETFVGSTNSNSIDGQGTNARFRSNSNFFKDPNTNKIYFVDRWELRVMDENLNVSSIDVGNDGLNDVCIDKNGNLFILTWRQVLKMDQNGTITVLAGSGGSGLADGFGTNATFDNPQNMAIDSKGNLYINSSDRIRKITPSGLVTTIAGARTSTREYDYVDSNNGLNARFFGINNLTIDANDNLYASHIGIDIGTWTPAVIRKIITNSPYTVSTIAGKNQTGDNSILTGSGNNVYVHAPNIDALNYDPYLNKILFRDQFGIRAISLNSPYTVSFVFDETTYRDDNDGPSDWPQSGFKNVIGFYHNANNELCVIQETLIKRFTTYSSSLLYTDKTSLTTIKCDDVNHLAQNGGDPNTPLYLNMSAVNLTKNLTLVVPSGFQINIGDGWVTSNQSLARTNGKTELEIRIKPITHSIGTLTGTLIIRSNEVTNANIPVTWEVTDHPNSPNVSNLSRCDSGDVTLTTTLPNGADGVEWFYADNDQFIADETSITLPIETTTDFYVRAKTRFCLSKTNSSVKATVNYAPIFNSKVTDIVCDSGQATLSANFSSGTVRWWTKKTGGTQIKNGATLDTTLTKTTTFYVDAVKSGCPSGTRKNVKATVSQIHEITSTTDGTACQASRIWLYAATTGGSINWYESPNSSTAITTGNSYRTPQVTTADTFWIESINNTCVSKNRVPIIASIQDTLKANIIHGDKDICENELHVAYWTDEVPGADTYTWSVPGGATIIEGQGTDSIIVDFGTTEGFIGITPSGACSNNTIEKTEYLRMGKFPGEVQPIVGDSSVCTTQLNTSYEIPLVDNATSYEWIVNPNAKIIAGNDSRKTSIDFDFDGDTIISLKVSPISACGNGDTVTLNITINEGDILTTALDTAFVGEVFRDTLKYESVENAKWTILSTLPDTIQFADSIFTGNPSSIQEGNYSIVVSLSDSSAQGCEIEKEFDFNILHRKVYWDGEKWINGEPNENTDIILSGNYSTSENGLLTGHGLTITSGDTLHINSYDTVKVHNLITYGTGVVTIKCLSSINISGIQNGAVILIPPTITPENPLLPTGFVDTLYQFDLSINNLPNPTWSLTNGSQLPTGLSLINNVINGTPSQEGDFTFSVNAKELGCMVEKEYTIRIGDLLPSFLTVRSESKIYGDSSFFVETNSLNTAPITYRLTPSDGCASIDSLTGEITILCGSNSSIIIEAQQASDGIHFGSTASSTLKIRKAIPQLIINSKTFDIDDEKVQLEYTTNTDATPLFTLETGNDIAQINSLGEVTLLKGGVFSVTFDFAATDKYEAISQTIEFNISALVLNELIATELITPNNDGLNEAFEIRNRDNSLENEIKILSRNGEIILDETDYQNNWFGENENNGFFYFIYKEGTRELKGQFELRR